MAGIVTNCKKCNKIFQQQVQTICPECLKQEEENVLVLYRILQKSGSSGGIAIDELSQQVGVPIEDIEKFYLEGRLSTGGIFLKMPCQSCGVMCREQDRKGRYCVTCSEITANKAGVEVKTVQELQKEEAQELKKQQQSALLKKNQPKPKEASRFGFIVRS